MPLPPQAHTELPRPVVALRWTVAILLGIHGWYRALTGGATGFSAFLTATGFPFALAIAWAVTLFEIAGSACLLVGRLVRPACAGFLLVLAGGIVLVHGREGWFVVGAGRNGIEYSLLLMACLVILDRLHRAPEGAAQPDPPSQST